jgi:diphthamide synthase (EF-2-diphthine--ammonia ligase)
MQTVRTQLGKAFGQLFDQKYKNIKPKMQAEAEIEQLQKKIRELKEKKN